MTESSDRWLYRTEDGHEYGPYTLAEVRDYINQNRITVSGSLKLDNSDAGWMTFTEAVGVYSLLPNSLPGHPSMDVPATVRIDPALLQAESKTSESIYVILAIIFGVCLGLFGIHNFVAGYSSRGVVQLALGIFGVWGMCLTGSFVPGCFVFAVVLWAILTSWVIVEVVSVKKDSTGMPFKR